ncbi:MAG: hypothetical protein FWE38_01085 [Firmicutes bacterium]|nr:hypothetical protein [Bacillota bacterium]
MACIFVHLAVAKRYLSNHKGEIENEQDFIDGNVLPDVCEPTDKEDTHYGIRSERVDILKRFSEKISLPNFLRHNKLDSDINRGRFLHLITDWEYYNTFLPREYIRGVDLVSFFKDHMYTLIAHSDYLKQKHGVTFDVTSMEQRLIDLYAGWRKKDIERWGEVFEGKLLFTTDEIDGFIERMGLVNLEDYATI